jgi:LCP family protein required for cell wall assembly
VVASLVAARSAWALISVTALVGAGVAWATYQDLDGGMQRSNAIADDAPRSEGAVNILVMGLTTRLDLNGEALPEDLLARLNAGESDRGGYNANTLMLVHVPDDGSPPTALSIPRDDYVDFVGVSEGPTKGKIKEAYGRAKEIEERTLPGKGVIDPREVERFGREAGRKAQVETVRAFLNVPVDHLVEISLVGFYHLAEAVGGVDVCLNRATSDELSGADFPAGQQHLDAVQALSFVRQRHGLPNGDLDRTKRQQAFLASVTRKLKDSGTFTDVGALQRLLDVAKKDVVIDAGWDILDFVRQAPSLTGGGARFHTLPIDGSATVDGLTVNVVDPTKIQAQVLDLIAGTPPPTEEPEPSEPASASSEPPPPPPPAVPCID